MRLTVSKKLNTFLVTLLLLGIGGAIFLATQMFTIDLVGQLKKGIWDVSSLLAGRVRGEMAHSAKRAQILGAVSVEDFRYSQDRLKFLRKNLSTDSHHLALSFYYLDKKTLPSSYSLQWRVLNSSYRARFIENDFETVDHRFPMDFSFVAEGKVDFKTALIRNELPVLRMAIPLVRNNRGEFTAIVVMDLDQQRLTSLFTESSAYASYLLDRNGSVLASSDPQFIPIGSNLSKLGIIEAHAKNGTGSSQLEFVDGGGNEQLAAFHDVGFAGLTVVSQVPLAIATAATEKIERRGALLAGIFLFLALTFGLLFSKKLTHPIARLARATEKVGQGDFGIRVPVKGTKRGDEIQQFTQAFNQMVEGLEERERLKGVFSKFHDEEITEMLLSGEVKLGGERLDGAVMFADIRNFTQLSESRDPELIVTLLNRYFNEMVSAIREHGGIVDKYVGDTILALWGVPKPEPLAPYHAVRSCLEMRQRLEKLNITLKEEGLPSVWMGIGINYGTLIAGNIGSEQRMDYTVIGDTVNTASRIEAATKQIGTDFLVSQSVFDQVKDRIIFGSKHSIAVKGKSQELVTYRVEGYRDESGKEIRIQTDYSEYDPAILEEENKAEEDKAKEDKAEEEEAKEEKAKEDKPEEDTPKEAKPEEDKVKDAA